MARPLFSVFICDLFSAVTNKNGKKRSGHARLVHMAKYPNFKFEVLNTSRVMTTQGKPQYVHLSQFPGHKGEFTIQCLIPRPHSKWRNKCYHGDYVLLERVYYRSYFDHSGIRSHGLILTIVGHVSLGV